MARMFNVNRMTSSRSRFPEQPARNFSPHTPPRVSGPTRGPPTGPPFPTCTVCRAAFPRTSPSPPTPPAGRARPYPGDLSATRSHLGDARSLALTFEYPLFRALASRTLRRGPRVAAPGAGFNLRQSGACNDFHPRGSDPACRYNFSARRPNATTARRPCPRYRHQRRRVSYWCSSDWDQHPGTESRRPPPSSRNARQLHPTSNYNPGSRVNGFTPTPPATPRPTTRATVRLGPGGPRGRKPWYATGVPTKCHPASRALARRPICWLPNRRAACPPEPQTPR